MDSQELRNLQEAYMKVVMNEEIDKTGNHLDTYASKKYFGDKEKQEKLMRRMNRLRGKKAQPQQEQIDLYDIILSHLLDEGYAETPEAAEVIMVNMSEEWRGEIVEGYKKFPAKKIANKIDRMYNDPNIDNRFGKDAKRRNEMMRVSSHMKGEVHPLIRSESPKKSKAKESENKAKLKYKK
jgi:hypothetical protein